jgi:hypothetical protein
MGCTESVPVAAAFDQPHSMHVPPLYTDKTIDGQVKHQLVVKEKLFTWSGDSFKIKTLDGQLFGNGGIQMKGKAWALRDQMALLDANGAPIAVCLRMFDLVREIFKIYTLHKLHTGQTRSEQQYNGQHLYTYAEVRRVPFSSEQQVIFEGDTGGPAMSIHLSGIMPKKRTVHYRGRPAALMEGGSWNGAFNSYLLTVCPGVDPCLIVCLCAICDEMDEK